MKRITLSAILVFIQLFAFAQTDTTFWFAAPDISSDYSYDRPIHLRISSLQQPCMVTVSQPANGGLPTQTLNIPANSTQSIDLTTWLSNIECAPGDVVQNKGIKITSDNKISVYYEVNANGPNPELFSLKGGNALGNQFYISSQYILDNTPTYNPLPYSSFNIVASQDNTVVTITPTKNIIGHAANVPFNITLNKGQTYAAIATSQLASQHLQGSYVNATKPISITLSDDLLYGPPYGGICSDLAGDQTVPTSVVGTEYIAFQSSLNSPYDKVYITATQNATSVTQDGVLITSLNAGQSIELTVSNSVTYIKTSAPAYAYQLSGYGCEAGSAVLPKINCTGSSSVSVARSTNETFTATLLIKNGSQNNFLVNGVPGIITAGQFNVVPGTGGIYYYAKIDLPLGSYPNGTIIKISNSTDIFQCGILEGDVSGVAFGYFSDFNTINTNLFSSNSNPCTGTNVQLSAGTISSATYSWSGPNGFSSSSQNPMINNVSILNSGKYILTLTEPGCGVFKDSITIAVRPKPASIINQAICAGQNYAGYTATGTYIDTLVAANGCDSVRTINLTVKPRQFASVSLSICQGQTFLGHSTTGTYVDTLVASNGCDSILTINLTVKPRSFSTISQTICQGQTYLGHGVSGTYIDTLVAANGCDSLRTLNLTVKPKSVSTVNQSICQGQSFAGYNVTGKYVDTLIAANGCDSIRTINLIVNSKTFSTINQVICPGQSFAGYTTTGTYVDTLINSHGCDSIRTINLTLNPRIYATINVSICQGQTYLGHSTTGTYIDTLTATNGCDSVLTTNLTTKPRTFSSITQIICEGQNYLGHNLSGTYVDTLVGANGCDSLRTLNLTVKPKSFSTVNQSICAGQTYAGYSTSGTYVDTLVSANGCDSIRTINLAVINKPVPNLGNDTSICINDKISISPGIFDSYLWQDGSTQNPFTVTMPGLYSVTVSNLCGSANDNIVISERSCEIYFPNAFTPNADGNNDVFNILNAFNLQDYHLAIFDRWGVKVFESNDYTKGWNGKIKDVSASVGVYVWYCNYKKGNVPKFMKGTVTLLR